MQERQVNERAIASSVAEAFLAYMGARVTDPEIRFAARGFQIRRKDKDTMSDTGGVSKSREREPHQKPPRDDVKERYRTKDKPAPERERDTDKDTDTSRDTDTKGDKDTKIRESRFAAIEERICDKNLIFSSNRRRKGGNATVANSMLSRFPKTFGALLQKSG
jgi:hypothetical protein